MKKIEPNNNIKKGDVWIISNPESFGSIQYGVRPHVIVTQVIGKLVTVAPCTSHEKLMKHAVHLNPSIENGLTKESYVLLFQSFAADIDMLHNKIGHLSEEDIMRIQLEYVRYVTE